MRKKSFGVCLIMLGVAFGYIYAYSTIENKVDTYTGYDQAEPLAHIHVGDRTVNNSTNSQILISRYVDNDTSGNGHAFSDSSCITRSGTIGYNSFDARVDFSGSNGFDHYAAFQAIPNYDSTGTMADLYALYAFPIVAHGTITNVNGVLIENPSGAGSITNNYGLYIKSLTKGSQYNYGIYTESAIGIQEMTLPQTVRANSVYIAARDVNGKTELVAVFPTGAVQRLAIEP